MPQYRHVYFRPWIGAEYEGEGLWGRRVLIAGESHYDEWSDPPIEGLPPPLVTKHELSQTFTEECIREVANGERGVARFWNWSKTSLRRRRVPTSAALYLLEQDSVLRFHTVCC